MEASCSPEGAGSSPAGLARGAGSQPACGHRPVSKPGPSQCTVVFSAPKHPQGPSSWLPTFVGRGPNTLLSASPPTGKSKTDSQLVCYSCLDYSLQAGWDDLMDLIRKSWLCALFMLLFGFPLQPCAGRSVRGGAGDGAACARGPGSRPVAPSCVGNLCPLPAQGSRGSQDLVEGFLWQGHSCHLAAPSSQLRPHPPRLSQAR